MRYALIVMTLCLGCITSLAISISGASAAEPVTGISSPRADWSGSVEFVDGGGNKIVVDDREFSVQPDAVIHGTRAGRSALRKGMKVDIRTELDAQGSRVASEIWLR